MFSSCSNEINIFFLGKTSLGFLLFDALKFLIYKKRQPARDCLFLSFLVPNHIHYSTNTNSLPFIGSKAIPGNNDHMRARQAFKAGLYSETKYKKTHFQREQAPYPKWLGYTFQYYTFANFYREHYFLSNVREKC